MRIKEGFELREICGEHVILSHGMDNIDQQDYFAE